MGCRSSASIALLACVLHVAPDVLAAQAARNSFLELSAGLALKASYGVSNRDGLLLAGRAGRYLAAHTAVRLETDFQSFGAGQDYVALTAPCRPGQVCPRSAGTGAGRIRILSALASIQYHEQADRRGFYLVAGFGPQLLASHPDRSPAVRLATQAGVGLLLDGAAFIEGRYQPTLGAQAEPRHVVLVSIGMRWPPDGRVPN
ncbi:MAG TPA: hypothetical protein VMT29_04540 [Steroidobacteraceae bacterium]|nr:hypothetical protein [Steroidobacteraceae bacterium]